MIKECSVKFPERVEDVDNGSIYGDLFSTYFGGYLLDQLNTSCKIHSEIDKDPVDTFSLVLFLFKNEHVMVKELLQLLICEVNTQLFEPILLF